MNKQEKINRKTFFKWASLLLLVPFYKLWQKTVSSEQAFSKSSQTLQIDANLSDGVYFHDHVILVKDQKTLTLLSSKCTHLGCKINKIENGELVCPCHGSRYNLDGFPKIGPSVKQLTVIDFQADISNGILVLKYKL